MGVVKTYKWLKTYIDEAKQELSTMEREQLQIRLLVAPVYQELDLKEQVGKYRLFMEQGLFSPKEAEEVERFLARDIWQKCARHLKRLMTEWNGPDIRVFLFPANRHQYGGKNGLLYDDRLLLFVSSKCSDDEVLALLTHEYHHVCRLEKQSFSESTITLLESIVMEGLAEYAVNEYIGKQQLAPWTKWYSREQLHQLWKRTFVQVAHVQGRFRHYPYLFGSSARGIPRLAGYAVGYFLVTEYIERVGHHRSVELFQVSATDIVKSIFNKKEEEK